MTGQVIIDSALKPEDVIRQNPSSVCPEEILKRQKLLEVFYYSFDGELHKGQIVVDKDLAEDIEDAFNFIKSIQFPIASVIPISDSQFNWDDNLSTDANNTSGFNYRTVARTTRMSNHAFGRAIDINPRFNPFIHGEIIEPIGAQYDVTKAGTILKDSKIVEFFIQRGWIWGGNWENRIDYQHFEKPLLSL